MVDVRLMRAGDMRNFLDHFPEVSIQTEICMGGEEKLVGGAVVAEENGSVIGMGGIIHVDGRYEAWISVAPVMRRKVVFLYRALVNALNAIDCYPIYVRTNDPRTRRLAKTLGFRPVEGSLMVRDS